MTLILPCRELDFFRPMDLKTSRKCVIIVFGFARFGAYLFFIKYLLTILSVADKYWGVRRYFTIIPLFFPYIFNEISSNTRLL